MFAPEFVLFFSLFSRAFGFFFLSPLFKWQNFPKLLRLGFAFLLAALLFPTLLHSHENLPASLPLLSLMLLKEVIFGSILGLLFSLLFEAALFAGEMIGGMMGLSLTEVFDPLQNNPTPILGGIFALLTAALIFALDYHHLFIKSFKTSFSIVPIGGFSFATLDIESVIRTTSELFTIGFQLALLPFTLLLLTLFFITFASKIFPEMPILWLGIAAELLVGFIAVATNFTLFPELITDAISTLSEMINKVEWSKT